MPKHARRHWSSRKVRRAIKDRIEAGHLTRHTEISELTHLYDLLASITRKPVA